MERKKEGKSKLAEFSANRGSKVVEEALQLAEEFHEAPAKAPRKKNLASKFYDKRARGSGFILH